MKVAPVRPFGRLPGNAAAAFLWSGALVALAGTTQAAPLDALVRPLAVAALLSITLGVAVLPLAPYDRAAAAATAVVVVFPMLWWLGAALLAFEAVALRLTAMRLAPAVAPGGVSQVLSAAFFLVCAVPLAPRLLDYLEEDSRVPFPATSVPVYLILLDGYPRIDTLSTVGIDNGGFVDALESRGFDHYSDATSLHEWTHRTLAAMVAEDPQAVPDTGGSAAERESVRASLHMPSGFLVVDPPAVHVTIRGQPSVSAGGITDLEAHLLGRSMLGWVSPGLSRAIAEEGLRHHFEGSLELLEDTASDLVFAHLLAPHPPFFYSDGIRPCWPGCGTFEVNAAALGMSRGEWAEQMRSHLTAVNARLLRTLDRVLAEDPDAIIVLFSDHGARYGGDAGESHRTFLAARTPGAPGLLSNEPHPHAVLRILVEWLK